MFLSSKSPNLLNTVNTQKMLCSQKRLPKWTWQWVPNGCHTQLSLWTQKLSVNNLKRETTEKDSMKVP